MASKSCLLLMMRKGRWSMQIECDCKVLPCPACGPLYTQRKELFASQEFIDLAKAAHDEPDALGPLADWLEDHGYGDLSVQVRAELATP